MAGLGRRFWIVALLFTLVGSGGCWRLINKEAKRDHRWQKRMARGPDGAAEALRSARSLIAVPVTRDPATLFRYRMMAIRSITLLMETTGYDQALDDEAHRYYREALTLGDAATARRELARLYEHTGRRGKIEALLADVGGPLAPQDEYDRAILLWRGQFAKGDLAASELAWARAEALAAQLYDVEAAFPTDFGASGNLDASAGRGGLYRLDGLDWRARFAVLRERMLAIASPHDSPTGRVEIAEIVRLWSQYERIGMRSTDDLMGRSYGDTYRVYVDGARIFAIAGQAEAAQTLLGIARRAAAREVSEFRRADLSCAEAFVATRTGRADATQSAKRCLKLAARAKRELEIGDLVALGEAFERSADLATAEKLYREAIERAERQRESFPVEERTVFFRTSVRRGYWGLARTLARRSEAAGSAGAADFLGALEATEQVRARQLGELLAEAGQRLGRVDDLAGLQARLGPGDVLLDYVTMDDDVLLLALTRDAWAVRFIPLDSETIGRVTAEIAAGLSAPTSSQPELDQALTLLGRALILPARALTDGKQRFVVLPDGPLNAVPFDLLDLKVDGYHPLLEDAAVEVTPSLSFFMAPERPRAQGGLLGVADPVYGPLPDVQLVDESSRAAARAATQGYFRPLPETRTEVETIARTLGGASKLLYGSDARESIVKRTSLRDFSIVHFATHGILGRDVAGIDEPALVLAGEPGEDGFLTASEASKLELGARLTVLSACKTGAGDSASGEGVLGMSRAFMVAGSQSVLVSLWEVDSIATEALMVEFYRRMQTGEPPATALRGAKLAVRDGTTPAPHPWYWGAFILVGR